MDAFDLPEYAPELRALEDANRGEQRARKALEAEVKSVACATKGTRNTELNRAAFSLGRKVASGDLQEDEVKTALMEAAQRSGLAKEDGPEAVHATIKSGLTAGLQKPEHVQDRRAFRPVVRGPAIIHPAPTRESQFYSATQLKGKPVPPRQWLVHGMVPQKTVTLFSGDGGTGKSLLALQLAVAAVAQTGWIGRAVTQGGAIFLSAEDDDDELHRRLNDILRAEGRDYGDLAGLTMRSVAGEDALLAVDTQLALMETELFRELDARAADENPALIVIDTLADVYPANENDRAKVRQFVGILRGLALKHECAVMLLGHPSLTGLSSGTGTSGSTAWNNSVRSRLYLSRIIDCGYEPDRDVRLLTTKKANYGRTGDEISLKWEAGLFRAEPQESGLDAVAAKAKAERVFLKLLDQLTQQGRYVSASPGPTYAPAFFAKHPEAEGVAKRALTAAMEHLLQAGTIRIGSHGRASKERKHIERAKP